jgi:predicted secreted Zn-dependent protease
MRKVLCLVTASVLALALPVAAKPAQKTKYKYYEVIGNSAPEIHKSMLKRGPKFGKVQAYGITALTYSPTATCATSASGKSTFRNYKFETDFVIKLPKLKDASGVDQKTKSQWSEFSQFVKSHEEKHREIWLSCTAGAENKIMKLEARSCNDLIKKADSITKKAKVACDKQHASFDAAEQIRVINLKFIRSARKTSSSAALQAVQ